MAKWGNVKALALISLALGLGLHQAANFLSFRFRAKQSMSSAESAAKVEKTEQTVQPVIWNVVYSRLNVRDQPSLSGKSVGTKYKGETVSSTGPMRGKWIQISPSGQWMLTEEYGITLLELAAALTDEQCAQFSNDGDCDNFGMSVYWGCQWNVAGRALCSSRTGRFAPPALDIGTWSDHAGTMGIEILRGKPPLVSDAHAIIKGLSANPNWFTSFPNCDVLGAPARKALMSLADTHHVPGEEDLKVDLSLTELQALVGPDAVASLTALFPNRVDEVKIRRVEAVPARHVINFHTDFSQHTMQVALNGEEEYEGGRLMYATQEGVQQPPRPAGSVTIHDDTIPHSVSEMVSGTRYGLFFLTKKPGLMQFAV